MDETSAWLARSAIAELITRYAALNDAGEWDALAALYTEDGRMSRPSAPEEFINGRAAILAAFRARPRRASRHIVTNILVTLDGEVRARATSHMLLFIGQPSAEGGLPTLSAAPPLIGGSDDRLVKTQAGWRFDERRGRLDFRT